MRAILFISYLFTMLFAGANEGHASTHKNTIASTTNWNIYSKKQGQFIDSKTSHSCTIIEYTDVDIDEEFSNNEEYNASGANKTTQLKNTFFKNWYLPCDNSFIEHYCNNQFYITIFISGKNTPIYIANSVLRI